MTSQTECCVCKEGYDVDNQDPDLDPVTLPCMHVFHYKCLQNWRSAKDEDTCPTCRSVFESRQVGYESRLLEFTPMEERTLPNLRPLSGDLHRAVGINDVCFFKDSVDHDADEDLVVCWCSPKLGTGLRTARITDLILTPACLPFFCRLLKQCSPRDRIIIGTILKTLPEEILDRICDRTDQIRAIRENPDNLAMIVREELLVAVTVRVLEPPRASWVAISRCVPPGVVEFNTEIHAMEIIVTSDAFKCSFITNT